MGIKKFVKKRLTAEGNRIKSGAKIVDRFIPGMGIVSNEVARIYKKMGKADKKKVHKAQSKTAKRKIINKSK